jgi:predicted Ser/Thr protein kinase
MTDGKTKPLGLSPISKSFREHFEANKRILTFVEYLDYAFRNLPITVRDAATYVRDCFDHFGSTTIERPWGQERRWNLFDIPFDEGRNPLAGQEAAQDEIYRLLSAFAEEGRVDRLIVLNGPNGSAKSTLVLSIMRALEAYSHSAEGALYTFNWVFPSRVTMSRIGFQSTGRDVMDAESFAHLLEGDVDARLKCEVRDHPLLILPREDRMRLLREETERRGVPMPRIPELISRGGLCHKCKHVFDALVTAYHGDLSRVLQHVQVERWFVSRLYRRGAVTIGPQLSVDASERQISADRSLAALPSSLQMATLFEPYGELVDATGGVLDFADFLKRPLDAFKYLLATIETGEVSLSQSILRLNSVMLASTNDVHLNAFREHPEYASFRGRISVVRVPYIRDWPTEQRIYDTRVLASVRRHVAPHATEAAARWAVLTRMKRPDLKQLDGAVSDLVKALTAAQKGELYAGGRMPDELKGRSSEEIRGVVGALYHESDNELEYEGRNGASPREIRAILSAAASDDQSRCLSPRAVFRQIEALCGRKSEHAFLQRKAQAGRFDGADELLDDVKEALIDLIEDELRTATGLVAEERHVELLERYVIHVRHWVEHEKIFNKVTGKDEDPDIKLMAEVEEQLDVPPVKVEGFRRSFISVIGGFAIEHPGEALDVRKIFPDHLATLRASYYQENRERVGKVGRDALVLLAGDRLGNPEDQAAAESALKVLYERFGYCDACAGEALSDLVRKRFET